MLSSSRARSPSPSFYWLVRKMVSFKPFLRCRERTINLGNGSTHVGVCLYLLKPSRCGEMCVVGEIVMFFFIDSTCAVLDENKHVNAVVCSGFEWVNNLFTLFLSLCCVFRGNGMLWQKVYWNLFPICHQLLLSTETIRCMRTRTGSHWTFNHRIPK